MIKKYHTGMKNMKKGITVCFQLSSSGPDLIKDDEKVRNKYSRKVISAFQEIL
jgi:hypothetical protein